MGNGLYSIHDAKLPFKAKGKVPKMKGDFFYDASVGLSGGLKDFVKKIPINPGKTDIIQFGIKPIETSRAAGGTPMKSGSYTEAYNPNSYRQLNEKGMVKLTGGSQHPITLGEYGRRRASLNEGD